MKPVKLIKMHLKELCSEVHICKHLSLFPTQNGLTKGNVSSLQFFSSALEYAIRKVQESNDRLEINDTHQLLVCCRLYDNIVGKSMSANRKTQMLY
jgi:hypothetical protein